MHSPPPSGDSDSRRVTDLTNAVLHGHATDEQFAELEQLLHEKASYRESFLRHSNMFLCSRSSRRFRPRPTGEDSEQTAAEILASHIDFRPACHYLACGCLAASVSRTATASQATGCHGRRCSSGGAADDRRGRHGGRFAPSADVDPHANSPKLCSPKHRAARHPVVMWPVERGPGEKQLCNPLVGVGLVDPCRPVVCSRNAGLLRRSGGGGVYQRGDDPAAGPRETRTDQRQRSRSALGPGRGQRSALATQPPSRCEPNR